MVTADSRILSRPAMIGVCRQLRQQGKKLVFTNGCFDLLHRAHVEYLREARRLGDALIVGLNSDSSARQLKGTGRPLMPEEDRALLLAEMRCVDYVCIFAEVSVESLIADLLPDVLVKGGDYLLDEIVGRKLVERAGGAVRALSLWRGSSTSALLQKIRELPE